MIALGGLLNGIAWAHASGPDPRYTAAPGESPLSCASATCHTGSPAGGPINAAGGSVTATFSTGTSYTPGTPVQITVTVSDPVNRMYGFQMSARLANNAQAGTFVSGAGSFVICDDNQTRRTVCPSNAPLEFIEHSSPRNSAFSFSWTPPAAGAGAVTFYFAGNAVNFNGTNDAGDHVYTNKATLTENTGACNKPVVTSVNSGTDFGGASAISSGTWIEIKGSNFVADNSKTRTWTGNDFTGTPAINAPTSLDGVSASINSKAAYVFYISPGQINVNVPADSTGNMPLTVTNSCGTSSPVTVQRIALTPGLLAPAAFKVNGTQYVVAQFSNGDFVGRPGLLPGAIFRPAKPGDTVVIYGIGFGDVTPSIPFGTIVGQGNAINAPISFRFGSADAALSYKGLAPNFVGLYQFNVVVPNVPDGDTALNVSVNNSPLAQNLFLTVKR